jgi:hypothetical protein
LQRGLEAINENERNGLLAKMLLQVAIQRSEDLIVKLPPPKKHYNKNKHTKKTNIDQNSKAKSSTIRVRNLHIAESVVVKTGLEGQESVVAFQEPVKQSFQLIQLVGIAERNSGRASPRLIHECELTAQLHSGQVQNVDLRKQSK